MIHVHHWCPSNVSKLQTETWKKFGPSRCKVTRKQAFESLITINAFENLRSGQNFLRSTCFEEPFYTPNIILPSLPLPHVLHRSQFSEKKTNGKWQPNQMKKNTTFQVNVSSNLLCLSAFIHMYHQIISGKDLISTLTRGLRFKHFHHLIHITTRNWLMHYLY